MSITKKLAIGAIWNSISQFGGQGINFVVTLILARLLTPEDFGLVGMVTVFTSFLGYFSEFGLTPSLIQQKDIDREDEGTVFFSSWGFALIIYLVVYFLAPQIAHFYKNEQVVYLTRVCFLTFLAAPLIFVPEALDIKKVEYHNISRSEVISTLISGVISISLAFLKCGVWALVFQMISYRVIKGICVLYFTKWTIPFLFSYAKFKKHFSFGLQHTIKNLLQYAQENLDYLLVGKLLGARELGIYTMAFRLSKYPLQKLWMIFGQMLFPAFASFKDDIIRIQRNYLRISRLGIFVLWPFLLGLFLYADFFIPILLGIKWVETIPIVKIFIIYLLVQSIFMSTDSILIARNYLKEINIYKILSLIIMIILGIFLIPKYNTAGMAIAFSISTIAYLIATFLFLLKNINLSLNDYLKDIISLPLQLFLISIGLYFFNQFFYSLNAIIIFLINFLVLGLCIWCHALKRQILSKQKPFINITNI